jgi:LysR family cyn operon transcriptional activator
LRVTLEELTAPRIEERLRDGRLDLGVVRAWKSKPGITDQRLTEVPLRLLVNPAHALAHQRTAWSDLASLSGERFVLPRRGMDSRRSVDAYCEAHDFAPKIAIEANSTVSVLAMVHATRALVTILPVPGPNLHELGRLPMLHLPEPMTTQSTFLLWRAPEMRSDEAKAFGEKLREHLNGEQSDRDSHPYLPDPGTPPVPAPVASWVDPAAKR